MITEKQNTNPLVVVEKISTGYLLTLRIKGDADYLLRPGTQAHVTTIQKIGPAVKRLMSSHKDSK